MWGALGYGLCAFVLGFARVVVQLPQQGNRVLSLKRTITGPRSLTQYTKDVYRYAHARMGQLAPLTQLWFANRSWVEGSGLTQLGVPAGEKQTTTRGAGVVGNSTQHAGGLPTSYATLSHTDCQLPTQLPAGLLPCPQGTRNRMRVTALASIRPGFLTPTNHCPGTASLIVLPATTLPHCFIANTPLASALRLLTRHAPLVCPRPHARPL